MRSKKIITIKENSEKNDFLGNKNPNSKPFNHLYVIALCLIKLPTPVALWHTREVQALCYKI